MASSTRMLLAGDIGGTNTRLALFERGRPRDAVAFEHYASGGVSGLEEILGRFLGDRRPVLEAAAFGAAGPVLDGRIETTNLPWVLDAAALSRCLGGVPVFLLNDLEAFALGVGDVPEAARVVLCPGVAAPHGTRAVIAAGTGLGEAGLAFDGRRWVAVPSEGGHADFAPRSEREIALLRFLMARFGHVSWERVVSGPGLVNLLDFLHLAEGRPVPPALASAMATGDPGAAITQAALAGIPVAREALDLFIAAYGAETGNLALKLKATGGVFVGGGIAPRILPALRDGAFRASYRDKGRFAALLDDIPVWAVTDEGAALSGAAAYAEANTRPETASRAGG